MFTRHAAYHPYRPSAPRQPAPAGSRFSDHIRPRRRFDAFQGLGFTIMRSSDASPLNSPLKSPDDDAPPTVRLGDRLANGGLGSPACPSTPVAHKRQDPAPKSQDTNVPAQARLPIPPPRKKKNYGPKHPSFGSGAIRPGIFPTHRRGQKIKHESSRKRAPDHPERASQAGDDLQKLCKEAEALMKPEHMNSEDWIFLRELERLQFEERLEHDLEECREQMERAADETPKRQAAHAKRDAKAAKLRAEEQDHETSAKRKKTAAHYRQMEEAAMRADEKRQREHQAMERRIREEQDGRFREEQARKAKEAEEHRQREERRRRMQEEEERYLQEEKARRLHAEMERRRREERAREAREEHERRMHEERERVEAEERTRLLAELIEQARRATETEAQVLRCLALYEGKWNELRTSTSLPPIDVSDVPWPVFRVVSSANQVTHEEVRAFLSHPGRLGTEGKTMRDRVRTEVLRFHPDKFDARVLPYIQPHQRAVAQEIAGVVARILTRILAEDAEQ